MLDDELHPFGAHVGEQFHPVAFALLAELEQPQSDIEPVLREDVFDRVEVLVRRGCRNFGALCDVGHLHRGPVPVGKKGRRLDQSSSVSFFVMNDLPVIDRAELVALVAALGGVTDTSSQGERGRGVDAVRFSGCGSLY
jgi:hypothetical protein